MNVNAVAGGPPIDPSAECCPMSGGLLFIPYMTFQVLVAYVRVTKIQEIFFIKKCAILCTSKATE